jgi:hypothetical protein
MSERDRMLAEGPRVAPEPHAAGTTTTTAAPLAEPPVLPPGRSRWSFPLPLARLVPPAALALFLLAGVAGLGRYAWIAVVALTVITAFLRRRKARA